MLNIIRNLRLLKLKILSKYYTSCFIISSKIRGLKTEKNIKCIGHIYIYKSRDSIISIGEGCTFISLKFGNLIGIQNNCMISTVKKDAKVIIGNNCGFSGVRIGSFKLIKIGNNVRCGANTLITDANWHLDDPRSGEPKDVIIEDNVWLGEGVKVLKGVTIGENTIIGAGSVVVKSIPANVIAAGNPCKVIKEL